jgi:hypothetical protein
MTWVTARGERTHSLRTDASCTRSFPDQTWPRPTLLVKSRRSISKVIGVGFTKGMDSISLAPECRVQARFSARFCVNQQSHGLLYLRGE